MPGGGVQTLSVNDKGFAIGALLYPAFLIIITIVVLTLISLIQSSFSVNKLNSEVQGDLTDNNTMKSLQNSAEAVLKETKDSTTVYTATDGKIYYLNSKGEKETLTLNNGENTSKWLGKIFTKSNGDQYLMINNGTYCAYKTSVMSGVAVYNLGEGTTNNCVEKLKAESDCDAVITMLDDTNAVSDLQKKVDALVTLTNTQNQQITDLQSKLDSAVKVNNTQASQITTLNNNVANQHPVGSFYITQGSENPATLFGGTWTKVYDRFLVGAGSGYGVASTGGSGTHSHTTNSSSTGGWSGTTGGPSTNVTGSTTLTANQSGVPSHTHSIRVSWGDNGASYANVNFVPGSNAVYSLSVDKGAIAYGNDPQNAKEGHTHTLSNHTHSIPSHSHSIPSVGTSSASNIPPYYAVYMWVRTA